MQERIATQKTDAKSTVRTSKGGGSSGAGVLALQHAAGNQATLSALRGAGIWPKLEVGAANDPAEAEADRFGLVANALWEGIANLQSDGDSGSDGPKPTKATKAKPARSRAASKKVQGAKASKATRKPAARPAATPRKRPSR
jgi:hypothetical protein